MQAGPYNSTLKPLSGSLSQSPLLSSTFQFIANKSDSNQHSANISHQLSVAKVVVLGLPGPSMADADPAVHLDGSHAVQLMSTNRPNAPTTISHIAPTLVPPQSNTLQNGAVRTHARSHVVSRGQSYGHLTPPKCVYRSVVQVIGTAPPTNTAPCTAPCERTQPTANFFPPVLWHITARANSSDWHDTTNQHSTL